MNVSKDLTQISTLLSLGSISLSEWEGIQSPTAPSPLHSLSARHGGGRLESGESEPSLVSKEKPGRTILAWIGQESRARDEVKPSQGTAKQAH